MNTKAYLNKVAYIAGSEILGDHKARIYYSKYDQSYIARVGMENQVKGLADREITDSLTHGVGFSPNDGKWYGWSHRAIYGFKVGSTCKKGDCHYIGEDLKAKEEAAIEFWKDEYRINVCSKGIVEENGERFFEIEWQYLDNIPNGKLHSQINGTMHFITPSGKGEWVAETMEDAKQMAIDFCAGVS